jgi:curved DNA-binding protein CbpA
MVRVKPIENYYSILKVFPDSGFDEIRKSYKKMVLTYHPDVNKSENATDKFKEILKAYSILKDPELRRLYDTEQKKHEMFPGIKSFKYEIRKIGDKAAKAVLKAKLVLKNISSESRKKAVLDEESTVDIFDELCDIDIYELEDRLAYSDNPYVRYNAAVTLGYKKSVSSFGILAVSLDDVSFLVKKGVIFALGELGMKKGIYLLKDLFERSGTDHKIDIIKAVFKISGKNSLIFNSLLLKGISDTSEIVRTGSLKILLTVNKGVSYESIKMILDKMSFKINENSEKMLYAVGT